jgi:hypothetical protein
MPLLAKEFRRWINPIPDTTSVSISTKNLKRWIDSIPDSNPVGVDDGGLTLQVVENPKVYPEGGLPKD